VNEDAPHTETLVVEEGDAGERLDKLIAARLPDLSRARVQALMRDGQVHLAGVVVKEPGRKAKAGEAISVAIPPAEPAVPGPEDIPLAVVFEDDEVIVIDKPAGLTVHPAPGHPTGTLVNALIAHCGASLSGIGGVKRPGIVHRLDKDTTGLMVVAKTDRAHQSLAAQFASHGADGRLERGYRALVWGGPERAKGAIDAPLGRSTHNRTKMAVVPEAAGRRAVTHFELVATYGATRDGPVASQMALTLETGRTHQVRVHMAHIGLPILGDDTYGAGFKSRAKLLGATGQEALVALGRQALHAAVLAFEHPVTRKRLRFSSDLPPDMARLERCLRALKSAPAKPSSRG
jgi:23S rRNA pseudouridine1911/1915/1917 synthase